MNNVIVNLITDLANLIRFGVISGDIVRALLKRKEAPKTEPEQLHDTGANPTQSSASVEPILEQRVRRVESELAVYKGVFGAVAFSAVVVIGWRMIGTKRNRPVVVMEAS